MVSEWPKDPVPGSVKPKWAPSLSALEQEIHTCLLPRKKHKYCQCMLMVQVVESLKQTLNKGVWDSLVPVKEWSSHNMVPQIADDGTTWGEEAGAWP